MKIQNLERAAELSVELKQMEEIVALLKKDNCNIIVESKDGKQRVALPHTRFFYDTLIKATACLNAIKNEVREL